MLSRLCIDLVSQGITVAVVARTPESLERLQQKSRGLEGRVVPMALNYHNRDRLSHWIAHFQLMEGPLDVVVAWIHYPAVPVLETIAAEVHAYRHIPWQLVHVVGSQNAMEPFSWRPSPPAQYQQVTLGFKIESGTSRWLTDQEIVNGVYAAIVDRRDFSVVGTVTPWERRPR